ncbi:flagellar basal body P-ring formation chaperone FlgA [Lysobacter yangpyeongensis]|uniref:Flagella basal body P-ring formation protein FlgA n=1 Tax=Lysobacter yangpyeongensis TaxID=346182 RepID=A0ABW0SJ15_9GAMM
MPKLLPPRVSLPLALIAWSTGAIAGAFHPTEDIRIAAATAVGAPADAQITLDPALRLVQCTQPLQAVASGPRTALVRCPDAPGWRVYVPVRAHREADVVVLAAPAAPGMPITAQQLVVQRREVSTLGDAAFADPAALVGRTPRRALAAGIVPTESDFTSATTLRRGDPVTLVARTGGVEVRMQGRALGPAQAGGVVTVENVSSRRILRGRIAGEGEVEILL